MKVIWKEAYVAIDDSLYVFIDEIEKWFFKQNEDLMK